MTFWKRYFFFKPTQFIGKFYMPMSFCRWGRGLGASLNPCNQTSNIPYLHPKNLQAFFGDGPVEGVFTKSAWVRQCFFAAAENGISGALQDGLLTELGTNLHVTSPGYSQNTQLKWHGTTV